MPLQHRCLAAEPPLTGSSDDPAAGASDGGCLGPGGRGKGTASGALQELGAIEGLASMA